MATEPPSPEGDEPPSPEGDEPRSDPLLVTLVTRGSPAQLTGGHLFHQRLADAAPRHGARLSFISTSGIGDPLRVAPGIVVIDSLAAWSVAPWLRRHRRPVAAMLHQPPGGIGQSRLRTVVQARLDVACYRRCALLLAASRALATTLVDEHGFAASIVRVVEPGADLPEVAAQLPDLRHGRRIAVLCVANWLPAKGIIDLLDAVARTDQGAITLHLAGREDVDTGYRARVLDRLARPDLQDRVVRHGPVSRETVAALHRAADVFALPSYVETYGTVYGEALAAGRPVVGWRAGNLPNLVVDGREGHVVSPGDVAGLAAALTRLASDDEWRVTLAAAAAHRGAGLPTWDAAAATFFGALRELGG